MNNKWLGFIIAVWIVGIFWASTIEGHGWAPGTASSWAGTEKESRLEYLMNVRNVSYDTDEVGETHFVFISTQYFSAWWNTITWKFAFLEGDGYEMVRWIVLTPFSIAAIFGLFYSFIQLLQGFIRL